MFPKHATNRATPLFQFLAFKAQVQLCHSTKILSGENTEGVHEPQMADDSLKSLVLPLLGQVGSMVVA